MFFSIFLPKLGTALLGEMFTNSNDPIATHAPQIPPRFKCRLFDAVAAYRQFSRD
jgi:hypothetical protein